MKKPEVNLEGRKAEIEKEFNAQQEELAKLNEQGKKLNQQMSAIREELVRLQGAYKEVRQLLGEKIEN